MFFKVPFNFVGHTHNHPHSHSHSHTPMDDAGVFINRPKPMKRSYKNRAFTVGIGGPVGSGKTALMLQLCRSLKLSIACVTNDIFTDEDASFLIENKALEADRIKAVYTGGCPHAAIREDISANLLALEELHEKFKTDILLVFLAKYRLRVVEIIWLQTLAEN